MFRVVYVAASAAIGSLSWVSAQTENPHVSVIDGTRVFDPAFFASRSPQTAADMLFDVPGFQLQRTGGGRGLGQGGVNVLINGARVSGKDTDPIDILRRTSADAVQSIEITDAARLGIPGLSGDVANVRILRDQTTGSFRWNATLRQDIAADIGNGQISVSGSRGNLSYTLGIENDSFRRGNRGPETVIDGSGNILEQRQENLQVYRDEPALNAALGYQGASGWMANLNASVVYSDFRLDELRTGAFVDSTPLFRLLSEERTQFGGEISGDLTIPAFNGEAKFILLYARTEDDLDVNSVEREADIFDGATQFAASNLETESIARVEFTWSDVWSGNLQLAGEIAFNSLEADSATQELDEEGSALGAADVEPTTLVEERRAETNVSYGRQLTERLSLQSSIGIEVSELSQPGSAISDRVIVRPKGFITTAYALNTQTDIRTRLERRVGQLDFNDFVSTADINLGTATTGSDDIVPQQSWYAEAEVERRFWQNSLVSAKIFAEHITDVVDRLPIDGDGDGFFDTDGPGNLVDAARIIGAEINATLNTTNLGIPGGEIEVGYTFQESELIDPLTGATREFNAQRTSVWEVAFDHEIPNTNLAYGFGAQKESRAARFQFDQRFRRADDPFVWTYIEHQDVAGATLRLSLNNPIDLTEKLVRTAFVSDRLNGGVDFVEIRERNFGPVVRISLEGTF